MVSTVDNKKIKLYMVTLILISFAAFAYSYRQILESYNSTVLAFSYKYGFISRALIGTLYNGLNDILPINLLSYDAALTTMVVVTLIIFVILHIIAYRTLRLCPPKYINVLEAAWVLFMVNVITTFSSKRNLGRLDIFMILLSVIAVYCIIRGRAIQVCILLGALGVMVHQGYVFMYYSMILVLLLYEYLTLRDKRYLYTLIISFILSSALFLYFQFFSHGKGDMIVGDIIDNATLIAKNGKYHKTLIQAEILGVDLTESEWPMHVENFIELPFYLLLMSPYLVLMYNFCKRLFIAAKGKEQKLKYIILICGSLTILPNFILKVDYARWILAVVLYYIIVIIALVVLQDKLVCDTIDYYVDKFNHNKAAYSILYIYPVLFLPFWDVHICDALKNISNPINEAFLNLW